jgi:nucleoside-diphosphate-sugar epimerase
MNPKRIAILGAGGFVGARMVESLLLSGEMEVVPVIRTLRSAAPLARFGPIWKIADAGAEAQLAPVISGCDAVVNLTVGDLALMPGAAAATWQACRAARVPRLVHLSSAEIYGQAEDPSLQDDSPPLTGHWMPYARAKIATEVRLRGLFPDPAVACVVLRPGLIWGPRSPWVEGPAAELSQGTAYLVGEGEGVCNLLHVDNLIASILATVRHPGGVSGCFNVADGEQINWRQYFEALAAEIAVNPATIHRLPAGPFRASLGSRLGELKQTPAAGWLKKRLSKQAKQRIKRLLGRFRTLPPNRGEPPPPAPKVTRSMWHLQGTRHKLPTAKFAATFGCANRLSFQQGMAGTGEWLRFAGFGRLNP